MATRISEIVENVKERIGEAESVHKAETLVQMLKAASGSYTAFAVVKGDEVIDHSLRLVGAQHISSQHEGSCIVITKLNETEGRKIWLQDEALPREIWC